MSLNAREAAEAAYDSLTGGSDTADEPTAEPVAEEVSAPAPEEAAQTDEGTESAEAKAERADGRDQLGRFAPKTQAEQAKSAATTRPPPGPHQAPTLPGAQAKPGEKPAVAPAQEVKPPQSLTAVEKEAFKVWPKEAQAAISRREKEYAVGLQKSAEAVRRDSVMSQVINPYAQSIQAMGGNVPDYVGNLLRTGYVFQYGAPAQKAQAVASIVNQFGVDLDLINQHLGGQAAPQQQQQFSSSVEQKLQARVDEMERKQAEMEFRRAQAIEAQTHQTINSFADKHPYLEDVRELMGDLMQVAVQRGDSTMDLERAYAIACQQTPAVSEALARQRTSQAPTSKVRAAAGSLRSRPSLPGGQQQERPRNAREAAEAAWDALQSRQG